MISFFIFKSNTRGMQYGIGTYIAELTGAMAGIPDVNIFLVSYNSTGYIEFSINKVSNRFTEIFIPYPLFSNSSVSSSEKKYALSVVRLLTGLMTKGSKVIFQINYLDDLQIALKLKESFKQPVISVVHFAQWQPIFEGNIKKLAGLNIDNPSNNIEFTLSKEREMYRISDHIISVTHYMKDFLVDYYKIPQEKISVIPNGLDHRKYGQISTKERAALREGLGFNKNEIIVLFSGRIDKCKGVYYLLEAFEIACRKNSHLRLVLIGQGDIVECQKRMRTSFGKVNFPGFISKELLTSFYRITDIGVVPSIYDHCPYSVLEMMACRIPVIASKINGLNEILDESCCLFINPLVSAEGEITINTTDLVEAIIDLAENKDKRADLGSRSYEVSAKKFTSLRMAKDMYSKVQSVTESFNLTKEYEKTEGR